MGTANFGIAGLDWQQRVNWDRMKKYRTERAREMMKKHGLGAMLCMYDENVRYLTGTLTPGWNRLKPGLRYAMLCGDGAPILFEQGDLGFQIAPMVDVVFVLLLFFMASAGAQVVENGSLA